MMRNPICWSEELRASPSLWQDCERVSPTLAEISCSSISELCNILNLSGYCGKTSPVYCQAKVGETFPVSSPGWSNSGMAARGECLTLNFLEAPVQGDGVLLSDIVQVTSEIPPEFFSTPDRTQKGLQYHRGHGIKLLPEVEALILQHINQSTVSLDISSKTLPTPVTPL